MSSYASKVLQDHPGGRKLILKYAGQDATDAFNPVHPPGVIDAQLPRDKHMGELDITDIKHKQELPKTRDELRVEREQRNKPSLSMMHSIHDLEVRTVVVD